MTDTDNIYEINPLQMNPASFNKSNLESKFKEISEKPEIDHNNQSKINENSPILNIEVISSNFEPKGLILKINPLGYNKSLRQANDGITYFGYEENPDPTNVRNFFFIKIFLIASN